MHFVTLQLRLKTLNPWPKLYVCEKEDVPLLLRGLPCALIVEGNMLPRAWHRVIGEAILEDTDVRSLRHGERDCHDAFIRCNKAKKSIDEFIADEFQQKTLRDLTLLIPVLQKYTNWKHVDLPAAQLELAPENTTPAFLFEQLAYNARAYYALQRSGPPLKLPSGQVLTTACAACSNNVQNMLGNCTFGQKECLTHMEFPGKSRMAENMRVFAKNQTEQIELLQGENNDEHTTSTDPQSNLSEEP